MLRGVLGVLIIALLAGTLLAIRLSQGPISLPGIARFVENHVNATSPSTKIELGGLIVSLGDGKAPSGLQFTDVLVHSAEDEMLFSAPRIAAAFQLRDVVLGRVQPTRVTIVEPELVLVRNSDGRIQVGMGTSGLSEAPDADADAGVDDSAESGFEVVTQIVDGFVGDRESAEELSKLTVIQVVDADLTYDDRIAGRKWRTQNAGIRVSKYARGARAVLTIDDIYGQTSGLSLRLLVDRPKGTGETSLTAQFGRVEGRELARQAPGLEWLALIDGTIEGRASAVLEQSGTIRDLKGVAVLEDGRLDLDGEQFQYDFARLAFEVDADTQSIAVREFSASAENLGARMNAVAELVVDDAGEIAGIALEAQLERLALRLPRVFKEDLEFDSGSLTARWDRLGNVITVASADLRTMETTFNLSGRVRGDDASWNGDLRVAATDAPIEDILHIWPLDAAPNARVWVDENILSARIPELLMQLQFGAGEPRMAMDFTFEELDARYIAGMSPLRSMSGEGFLGAERLDLSVDEGFVSPAANSRIALAGSRVLITDFSAEVTNTIIKVDGLGEIAAVLNLIDQPPLGLVRKLGVDLGRVGGDTDITADIRFPLVADLYLEQIDVAARAELRDLTLNYALTRSIDLALAADTLALKADTRELTLKGPLTIDGAPSVLAWQELYGDSAGSRTLDLESVGNAELLARFGIEDAPIDGDFPFDLVLSQNEGEPPLVKINANLKGAAMALPELGWEKKSGEVARIKVDLIPDDRLIIDRVSLDSADLDLAGSVSLDQNDAFLSADFSRVNLGKSFDVAATVERQNDGSFAALISGDYINLHALQDRLPDSEGDDDAASPALDVAFQVDRLMPTEDLTLQNTTGTFTRSPAGDVSARLSGSLHGRVNVSASLSRRGDGNGTMNIESPDAGAVLAAAGVYDEAEGGKLTISADIAEDARVSGIARVQDLSIASDSSFRNVLRGSGLEEVETEAETSGLSFRKIWVPFEITDDEIVLKDAIASSSALALKVNGTIDSDSGDLDLRGVISPAYGLTGALDNVPLLGTLLSGGEGEGILAMTFRLSGASKDPDFSFNPLSLLTPGFLRNVFEGESRSPSEDFTNRLQQPER
ncbi:MAG: AsmA-like C-terminal region-containing protein [Pseudomonadota bacterium]